VFTGLVESIGTIEAIIAEPPGKRLLIGMVGLANQIDIGDSVAINGCCLTAVDRKKETVAFEAGPETLSRTNLGNLTQGGRVNLERSLVVGDRLGGHFVTGHVDAVGQLSSRQDDENWATFRISMPTQLSKQLAPKGSIAVDGVSLTLVDVTPDQFSVALIPHTLDVTTLGNLATGGWVNLETDLLAKYVESQLAG